MKKGRPERGGAKIIIGGPGDRFPWFDGQGNYHQDVQCELDVCCQNVRYAKIPSTFLNHMVFRNLKIQILNWIISKGD